MTDAFPDTVPSGAVALLAGSIRYALATCAGLTRGELPSPTPCPAWDLGALLGHLSGSLSDLEVALRTGTLPAPSDLAVSPAPAGDPVETLRDRAADLLAAAYDFQGPALISVAGLPVPAGLVACTAAAELTVHGWDIVAARCLPGQPVPPVPPELASRLLPLVPRLLPPPQPGSPLFAAPVELPAQARTGDRLVALFGRDPRNTPAAQGVVTDE